MLNCKKINELLNARLSTKEQVDLLEKEANRLIEASIYNYLIDTYAHKERLQMSMLIGFYDNSHHGYQLAFRHIAKKLMEEHGQRA